MGGPVAGQQCAQVVGDHPRLPGLGVPGGPADVGGEDDIGHAHQRVIGRQPFTGEVVQAGGGQLAATQGVDERIGVVQLGPVRC